MQEDTPGDKAWEIFNLEYRLDDLPPLMTVFFHNIMDTYKQIFFFLWKLKCIESLIGQSWRNNQEFNQNFKISVSKMK
jgi:gamma-tubulin complex component 3